jgi:hypothetical protein
VAETLDSPYEDAGWGACVVECALVGGLLEESRRLVACVLSVRQRGCKCRPLRAAKDRVGMGGHELAYLLGVPVGCCLWRCALGQSGQGLGGSLSVSGTEVRQGLLCGSNLLIVSVELVPAAGGDDGENGRVQEHGQR